MIYYVNYLAIICASERTCSPCCFVLLSLFTAKEHVSDLFLHVIENPELTILERELYIKYVVRSFIELHSLILIFGPVVLSFQVLISIQMATYFSLQFAISNS